MEERELPGATRPQQVLNAIALGSMLVFASVMPPLAPEPAVADGERGNREAGPRDALAEEVERDPAA